MDLPRNICGPWILFRIIPILIAFLFSLYSLSVAAQNRAPQRPGLIRDTDVAEATDTAPEVKEPDPLLCTKNIGIGDYYYKRKNYEAAIRRYLDAIEYLSNSAPAFEALARAYEKNNQPAKAFATYQKFIKENPDSPKSSEFRAKINRLEKSVPEFKRE
jgi:tetratricopeptide (TPR) repeat protein